MLRQVVGHQQRYIVILILSIQLEVFRKLISIIIDILQLL
jgi:hypothetical protein